MEQHAIQVPAPNHRGQNPPMFSNEAIVNVPRRVLHTGWIQQKRNFIGGNVGL